MSDGTFMPSMTGRETELKFKLYRQATDKIVGISDDGRIPRGLSLGTTFYPFTTVNV